MKKLILATTLLFTGCSYKSQTFKNTFEKQKEIDRDDCQKPFANLKNNKITIKEKCLLTYEGIRSETYDECEFDTGNYIGGSIMGPIAGLFMFPIALLSTITGIDKKQDSIKLSLLLLTYPISAPFYRPSNCKGIEKLGTYKLNPTEQYYKGKETLKFQDIVNIHPDKEIWIGDEKHQYPLRLNDDLTYYMPDRLIKYFCEDKNNCDLIIYTKDDDKLKKLTTINLK